MIENDTMHAFLLTSIKDLFLLFYPTLLPSFPLYLFPFSRIFLPSISPTYLSLSLFLIPPSLSPPRSYLSFFSIYCLPHVPQRAKDWWTGPFPRMLPVFRGKYKSISADYLRLELCPPPPIAAKDGFSVKEGSPYSGRWLWIGERVSSSLSS